jgi:hypothetical protein
MLDPVEFEEHFLISNNLSGVLVAVPDQEKMDNWNMKCEFVNMQICVDGGGQYLL